MKCENCGMEIPEGERNCPGCGAACSAPAAAAAEAEEVVLDVNCAYCRAVISGDDMICPNCGNEQFCCSCGERFTTGVSKCPKCGAATPAFRRQVAYLERENVSKWKWQTLLIFAILLAALIALGASSWGACGVMLALIVLRVAIHRVPKAVDGKAIVSAPGYWQEQYPVDMEAQKVAAREGIVAKRPSVFSKLTLVTYLIAGGIVAVGVITDITIAAIDSAREQQAIAQAREAAAKITPALKNKTTYDFNGVKLEMAFCPAGSFTMGSPSNEPGRGDDEKQHKVTLTMPFLIGKYEVTQKQYRAVMGKNPSRFQGDDRPVEMVSWDDAMEFCDELNELTEGQRPEGYKFTLPTEAQWEYACRAGTTTGLNNGRELRQPYGEDIALNKLGWYRENSGDQTHHPVGQKQPNAWGIYDMHGNVWEWCRDWYGSYSGDAVDPTGPSSGSSRVSRGGGWNCSAGSCRSACHLNCSPGGRAANLGFRVVLAPVQ